MNILGNDIIYQLIALFLWNITGITLITSIQKNNATTTCEP